MADLRCDSISRVYRLSNKYFIVISEEFLGQRDDDARSGFKIFDDEDIDVIQSLDRHIPGLAVQNRRPCSDPTLVA